jgi:hypothetical protein
MLGLAAIQNRGGFVLAINTYGLLPVFAYIPQTE